MADFPSRPVRYSTNIEDKRDEPYGPVAMQQILRHIEQPFQQYLQLQQQDENDNRVKIQQHVVNSMQVPESPLGRQLGVHQIVNSPTAQRWIDRQQQSAPIDAMRKLLMGLNQ